MEEMYAYQMTAKDKPFEKVVSSIPETGEDEALVKIAGCGVCHTDLSFWQALWCAHTTRTASCSGT